MTNLTRLLSRRPRIDEAEVEDVRERTMARLAALGGEAPAASEPVETAATHSDAVAPGTPAAEMPAPAVEATAAPLEALKPTGPKVIVPRTIALGPAPVAPTEATAHRTPPIIVTGEPETAGVKIEPIEAVVEGSGAVTSAEPVSVIALPAPATQEPEPTEIAIDVAAAVDVTEVAAGPTVVDAATELEIAVEATVVNAVAEPTADEIGVEAVIPAEAIVIDAVAVPTARTRKSKASAMAATDVEAAPTRAKATPAPAKATAAPVVKQPKAKTAAAQKPAKRQPRAVPVQAQPTPVIDPDAVWPGRWLRDVSPEMASDAGSVDPKPVPVPRDPSLPVPRVAVIEDDWDGQTPEVAAVNETADAAVAVAEPIAAESVAEPIVAIVAVTRTAKPTAPAWRAQVATPRAPRPRPAPPPRVKTPPPTPPTAQGNTIVAAFCPYCALALEPPPTASRRCIRCRQRIVVKRVQARVVYLTEAAVEVFDSERLRSANFGRWSKERAQWLKLATSVGADAGRIARLGDAPLSEKVVESSRTLYLSTTERSFREAKRDDRWEDASRYKRDQAAAMHRLAGSPVPPTREVIALHREAAASELRGIGKMARDAELVGSTCCSTCAADDGRAFRIVTELRTPRLPHEGCPKGLCHCRWEFALRDATMVRRYLKRTRGKPKAPSA